MGSETGEAGTPAITTPFWDGVMVGGLSLVGMPAALAYVFLRGGEVGAFDKFDWVVLSILINSTHFMASYVVLYESKESVRNAPWAAVYIPVLLCGLLLYRMFAPGGDGLADAILLISSIYLAVHYAGQAWGMVASFAHLSGVRFKTGERHAIRSGMRALLLVHVLLAVGGRFPPASWMAREQYLALYQLALNLACLVAAGTLFVGAAGFLRARRRGERVPLRSVIPWLSLYFWYPTWFFVPGGPLWVQLSHALQYLSFPLRVEANRFAARSDRSVKVHIALVYLGLVVIGTVVLKGPPLTTRVLGPGWYSEQWMRDAFGTFVLLVNIHHFFIDGALWKLRNPEVRRALFAHVRPKSA